MPADGGGRLSRPLTGVVPIVVTPFDQDDRLDRASLARLVEYYCRGDIAGIVVPAVASEVDKLTPAEQHALIDLSVQTAAGRVPVIGGVLADTGRRAARLAESALRAGTSGILCRAPAALAGQNQALLSYFSEVAVAGMDYLVIQDLAWNDFGMDVGLLMDLVERLEALQAVKIEVARTGYKASQLLAATCGAVQVWSGWAMLQMIEALDRGIGTFNPSAYHRPFVAVCATYRSGDRPQAVRLFEQVLPYLAWSRQHIDINLHLLKRYCMRLGLFATTHLRPPAAEYDAHHERYGQELIERMLAWEMTGATAGSVLSGDENGNAQAA